MDVLNRARDVLIVDDVPENLRVLSSVLREKGYDVRTVLNAKMAFSAIQVMQPDLILLDVNLPDMNGYSVCEKLKENPEMAEIPIIFLSALGEIENKVSAFQAGGVDYITKPFQIEEVLARVGLQLKLSELAEDLKQKNLQLNQLITHLSGQNEELMKAREQAEQANQAKSLFLSRVNHELRTPLTAILGYNQLLINDTETTLSQRESMVVIERSGRHLLALINDVLDLSKIEANCSELTLKTFDIRECLYSIYSMFRLEAESKGLTFSFQENSAIPTYVRADEHKIRQILINLLGNALKFTSTGYVCLSVEISSIKSEGNIILSCSVEDSGVGIPAAELSKLFEPFQQTAIGQQSGQGTGLGLCISRQLARLMEGEIRVETREGQGSKFLLEIPIEVVCTENNEQTRPCFKTIREEDSASCALTKQAWAHTENHNEVSFELIKVMPKSWLKQLYDSLTALDEVESENLLSAIPENLQSLRKQLRGLLIDLNYEPILTILEQFDLESEGEKSQFAGI